MASNLTGFDSQPPLYRETSRRRTAWVCAIAFALGDMVTVILGFCGVWRYFVIDSHTIISLLQLASDLLRPDLYRLSVAFCPAAYFAVLGYLEGFFLLYRIDSPGRLWSLGLLAFAVTWIVVAGTGYLVLMSLVAAAG